MQSCLKSCGDCASAKNLPRLQPHRHEEVARPLGRPLRHRRRPHVDEAELVHLAADRGITVCAEAQVALHALAAHVEPAVAQAQHLVDVLLAIWNGSGSERETIRSVSTCTSISPVGMFGFTASGARATTSPSAWSTNSLRISCAVAAASGARSGLMTSCTLPE